MCRITLWFVLFLSSCAADRASSARQLPADGSFSIERDGPRWIAPASGLEVRLGADGASLRLDRAARSFGPSPWSEPVTLGFVPSGVVSPWVVDGLEGGATRSLGSVIEWWKPWAGGAEHGVTLLDPSTDADLDGIVTLDLAVLGGGVVVDDDGRGITIERGGRALLRYDRLRAWDALGHDVPARLEPAEGGVGSDWARPSTRLRLVAETGGAAWPIEVDPIASVPEESLSPPVPGSAFGSVLGTAGDTNGDGYDDLAVGAPSLTNGEASEGGLYVYLGGSAGLSLTPAWSAEGGSAGAALGSALAHGDANGDGMSDLFVGAPGWSNGDPGEGRAVLYLGAALGLSSTPAWVMEPDQAGAAFGADVAMADLDGDADSDLIVGSPLWESAAPQADEGRVWTWLVAGGVPAAAPSRTVETNQGGVRFGALLAAGGDSNGDGFSDLIVGATHDDSGFPDAGKAYLFPGSATGLSPAFTWTLAGAHAASYFPTDAAFAGDLQGDGFADLWIGEGNRIWPDNLLLGHVRAFSGSAAGLGTTPSVSFACCGNEGRFVAAPGDVNGDGYPEVVTMDDPGLDSIAARVHLWWGGTSMPQGPPVSFDDGSAGAENCIVVAAAGDVDGDGFADVARGCLGVEEVDVLHGSPTAPAPNNLQLDLQLYGANYRNARVGDVNGDGFDDLLSGTGAGTMAVRFGTATGVDQAASWSAPIGGEAVGKMGGDLDGDGYADLVLGDPGATVDQTGEGVLHIFHGSPLGLESTASQLVEGNAENGGLGAFVKVAGDINRDGYMDLCANAPLAEGAVDVWLGGPTGVAGAPVSRSAWGQAVHAGDCEVVGDQDGDGWEDLLVGVPDWTWGQSQEGRVMLFAGGSGGAASSPFWGFESDNVGAHLGQAVVSVGDANGDTLPDFAAGAGDYYYYHAYNNQGPLGHVYAWYGGPGGPNVFGADFEYLPGPYVASGGLGGLLSAGDVDGDGDTDLLASNRIWNVTGESRLFLAGPGGYSASYFDMDFTSGGVIPGDLNGDGGDDIVIGAQDYPTCCDAQGYAWIYLSRPGEQGQSRGDGLHSAVSGTGQPIALGGGDGGVGGFDIVSMAARSRQGPGYVRVEAEVKELGVPFDGTGLVAGPWVADTGSGAAVLASASGLPADEGFQWRARVQFHPASGSNMRHSPWQAGGPPGALAHVRTACSDDQDSDGLCAPADPDDDGDGSLDPDDCDDADPAVQPGAPESCDALDSNCDGDLVDGAADTDADLEPDCIDLDDDGDGVVDSMDCDALDATRAPGLTEACDGLDNDCDNAVPADEGDGDADGVRPCAGDCDDLLPTTYPGATDTCDGIDNDCEGSPDDSDRDNDGDGVSECAGDCDDASATTLPAAVELCDGIDNDCDGSAPSEADGDGDLARVCAGDCDDAAAAVHPAAFESCDGVDNDCEGGADEGFVDTDLDAAADCIDPDDDGDGAGDATDCAPAEATISPLETDAPGDGIDQDCNGADAASCFIDVDGDTFGGATVVAADGDCDDSGETATGGDCDDGAEQCFPGAPELCDGLDGDCDGGPAVGEADSDGDGSRPCGGDCQDDDATVYPSAPEFCDGLDQDCDQLPGPEEADLDGDGARTCAGDCAPLDPFVGAGLPEGCDALDTDCDGTVPGLEIDDDGDLWSECVGDCDDAQSAFCPGSIDVSPTLDSNCDGAVGGVDGDSDGALAQEDCDDRQASMAPGGTEACDGLDNDCDGLVPAGELADQDRDLSVDCVDCGVLDAAIHPGAPELCDGLDGNCDGQPLAGGEADSDDDGVFSCAGDCDDTTAAARPGQAENCADGFDNDCDGTVDVDSDNDGDAVGACSGDCDDAAASVAAGAVEVCNGVDDDCDGVPDNGLDADGDGWAACLGDCDDADAAQWPGAPAICGDGRDEDCAPATVEWADFDGDGFTACDLPGDCWEGNPFVNPGAAESCNALDDDCDGLIDGGLDGDGDGFLPCTFDCDDDDPAAHYGAEEVCGNGTDEDCVGGPDDGCGDDDSGADDDTAADDDTGPDDDSVDDDDTIADGAGRDPPVAPVGIPVDCGGASGAAALVLPGLLLLRRRRLGWMRLPKDTAELRALVAAVVFAVPGGAGVAQAGAGASASSDAAVAAADVFSTHCAAANDTADMSRSILARDKINVAMVELTGLIDGGGEAYLRYWRAKLGKCIGVTDFLVFDMEAFIEAEGANPTFAALIKDARAALRRAQRPKGVPEADGPRVLIGLGGAVAGMGGRPYGLGALDLSLWLVPSPLYAQVHVRVGVGQVVPDANGDPTANRTVLLRVGAALMGRLPLRRVALEVGGGLELVPNPLSGGATIGGVELASAPGEKVLVGPLGRLGLHVPFADSPLGLRIAVEGGVDIPVPHIAGLVEFVVGR